ncbi:hypothetical protein LMK05_05645 [Lactococcus petauri]|nr:hypothetical protein LMK05_05645 [Lactococcus petauri]
MDQQKFELMIGLFIIAIGSFIMGAACVGIQLEKVKRQRDEALERLEELDEVQELQQGN